MNLSINKETVTAVLTEMPDKSEYIALLQQIIDEELAQDEMNTDLVDECTQAILDIENKQALNAAHSYKTLITYCHTNAFKKRIYLKRATLITAAVILATGITFSASPALAKQAKDLVFSIMESLGSAADITKTQNNEIVSIYAMPNEDTTLTVNSEDDIHPEAFTIMAVDTHNHQSQIPLSACTVQKERQDSTHILLIFSYEGCACSIMYQLEVTQ